MITDLPTDPNSFPQKQIAVAHRERLSMEAMIPGRNMSRIDLNIHPTSNGEYGVGSTPSFKNRRGENPSTFLLRWIPMVGDADTNEDVLEIDPSQHHMSQDDPHK